MCVCVYCLRDEVIKQSNNKNNRKIYLMSHQSAIFMSSIIKFGKCTHKGIGEMNGNTTATAAVVNNISSEKSVSDCEQ